MDEGKWIKEKPKFGKNLGFALYSCSHCKNMIVIDESSPFGSISEYKYCYNCGAKMEVEK